MRLARTLAAGGLVAFVGVFFLWPVAAVIGRGLSVDAVLDVAGDDRLAGVLWFTIWQATISTLLTVVAGLPGAWCLSRYRFPGRGFVSAAITVPFVLPTVVVASAFSVLLDPGAGAILAAHVFFNYAVVVRTVANALGHVDPVMEDAARVLGAGGWRVFRNVSLPLVRPAILSAASIVFLFCLTSFGVVLILGGSRRATVEVEIWRQTAFFLDLRTAAALGVIQLACVIASLAVYSRLQRRGAAVPAQANETVAKAPAALVDRAFLAVNLAFMVVFLGGPVAVLLSRAFVTGDGVGLDYFAALTTSRRGSVLFVSPFVAVRNSLAFAAGASVLAAVVGIVGAGFVVAQRTRFGRALDMLLMLPIGTSAVTLGFGFLIALDAPPFDFRGSPLLIPVAHALVAVPFVLRIIVPALRAVDPRLREAAAMLGASPARARLEVDVPLVARAALVAIGFAFAVSLGEFGATLFLARPDFPTIPIAIFRFLGQPGALNAGQAAALSTILMFVTGASIAAVERARAGSLGSF